MERNDFDELIKDGLINHPDVEAINLRFNLRCDYLEANGKTQAQAIAIATKEIWKWYLHY